MKLRVYRIFRLPKEVWRWMQIRCFRNWLEQRTSKFLRWLNRLTE